MSSVRLKYHEPQLQEPSLIATRSRVKLDPINLSAMACLDAAFTFASFAILFEGESNFVKRSLHSRLLMNE